MTRTPRLLRLHLCAAFVLAAGSCQMPQQSAQDTGATPEVEAPVLYRWWDRPAAIDDCLLAIGGSGVGSHMGMTRNAAMIEGRSKLRAALTLKTLELIETWLETTTRAEDLPGLRRLTNEDSFLGRIVATSARTAPVVMTQEEDDHLYALVALESPKEFLSGLASQLKQKVIQAEGFFPTQELKDTATQDLDALITAERERVADARAAFGAGPIDTEPAPRRKR